MKAPSLLIAIIAFTFSGCATFSSPSSITELRPNQSYWMSYDASRRGAVVIAGNSKVKTCAEPAPDVGLSFANSLKGDFKLPGDSSATGVDAALNATASALAGRDDVVLLAREALFRICEASMNQPMSNSEIAKLITTVFTQVAQIAKAQAQKSQSDADAARSNVQRLKLQLQQLQLQHSK